MRKSLATTLLAMVVTVVSAQSCGTDVSYNIKGKCPAEVSKVYIMDVTGRGALIDSAAVVNGTFELKGKSGKDAFLGIAAEASSSYIIFINDGTPIEADIATMTIKGSDLNNKLNGYDRQIDAISAEMRQYAQQYAEAQNSGKSEAELKALVEELTVKHINPLEEKQTSLVKQIIRDNADNIIPAAFVSNIMYDCELDELKELLSDKYVYASHPMAAQAKRYLANLEKKMSAIGTKFKDLELNDVSGQPHKLSEYCGKGNYVLIDFWASWCGPCRAEMPNVKANYEKYHPKGFEIVGLSFDSKEGAWKKGIADLGITWINLSDLRGWKSVAASTYSISSIPSSLLVDPEGKVVALDLRGDKLGSKLKEIYGF